MSIEEPIWVSEVKTSKFDLSELPESIEQEIRDYLNTEFAPDDTDNLLEYVGQFELWGKPIKCWDFGSSNVFATVQPYSDGYYIAVTDKVVANEKHI